MKNLSEGEKVKIKHDVEEVVWVWFICAIDERINEMMIIEKAKEYAQLMGYDEFLNDPSWFEKFKSVHCLFSDESGVLTVTNSSLERNNISFSPEITPAPADNNNKCCDAIKEHDYIGSSEKLQQISEIITIDEMDTDIFHIGDIFHSSQELDNKLIEFKKLTGVLFYKSDYKLLYKEKRKNSHCFPPNVNYNLLYYSLRMVCMKGYDQNSDIEKCEAFLSVKMSSNGQYLELVSMNNVHNHELKPETPVNTIVDIDKVNSNNSITEQSSDDENTVFSKCVDLLKNLHHCDVESIYEEKTKCLYFQNLDMKWSFAAYPEFLFIDVKRRPNKSRSSYIFLIEDPKGKLHIVAVFILKNECSEAIDWVLKTFTHCNRNYNKVKVIMLDRDEKQKLAFKKYFPDAKLFISYYHTIKIFEKETDDRFVKFSLSVRIQRQTKAVMKKLCLSSSQKEYLINYQSFKELAPEQIQEYFNKLWYPSRNRWVAYLTLVDELFVGRNNSKINHIFENLYFSILKNARLESYLTSIFIYIREINDYVDSQSTNIPTENFSPASDEGLYKIHLTDYAFKKVLRQINRSENCKILLSDDQSNTRQFHSPHGPVNVTSKSCQCLFWKIIHLPCCHILALRSIMKLSLYDEDLCSPRWVNNRHRPTSNIVSMPQINEKRPAAKKRRKSSKDLIFERGLRYKQAEEECMKLAEVCSKLQQSDFEKKIKFLKVLNTRWSRPFHRKTLENQENNDTAQQKQINEITGDNGEKVIEIEPSQTKNEIVCIDDDD